MQNNDSKHSAIICKNLPNEEKYDSKIMTSPQQSPDLNPIELLRDELDRKVQKLCPTSVGLTNL